MAIEVRDLSAWYRETQALKEVSLSFESNSVTALIGPSGCGKSTFVRCLNRMHEEAPGARLNGKVLVNGTDIYGRSMRARDVRQQIGMIFQRPNPHPLWSVFDNVAVGPRLNGLSRGSRLRELVELSLQHAGLWEEVKDRLGAPARRLSGGQQQRLCIARAIANHPQVLLMDEPCSALDPIATFQIEELIRQLKRDYIVVLVTHNIEQAGRVSDRTAFLLSGRLIEEGPTSELFSRPQKSETDAYLSGRFG